VNFLRHIVGLHVEASAYELVADLLASWS